MSAAVSFFSFGFFWWGGRVALLAAQKKSAERTATAPRTDALDGFIARSW